MSFAVGAVEPDSTRPLFTWKAAFFSSPASLENRSGVIYRGVLFDKRNLIIRLAIGI
jgi:hypothetical protein